jgi:hypothetical protein
MNWNDVKRSKEDSIRESTGNPMVKNPNPFEKNGKIYKSFSDYLKSDEYKEFLRIEVEAKEEYTQKAKEYFKSLEMDNQLMLFFYITNVIFKNYFNDNGSYRGLLYDKFGFGPEAYSLGCDSGMFTLHNSISTPDEIEARFLNLVKFLKLDLSKEDMKSLRNIFEYGFDNSQQLNSLISGQQKLNFNQEDPE